MSISYRMEYQVTIQGSQETFENISDVVQTVPDAYLKEAKKLAEQSWGLWDQTSV